MNIKCVVSATNANGEPDLYFVIVQCTVEQFESGLHYAAAKASAETNGYEAYLAYDEFDTVGKTLLPLFEWDTATITIIK